MADADLRFFLGGGTALNALRLPSIIIQVGQRLRMSTDSVESSTHAPQKRLS